MNTIDLYLLVVCGTTFLTACANTCRSDGPDPRRGGGGGPGGPGWGGGYGDDATGADGEEAPACSVSSTCEQSCLKAGHADTAQCGGITEPAQKQTCMEAAQARLSGCTAGCATVNDSGGGADADEQASVSCVVPGSQACVDKCAGIGAFCFQLADHPYSPSSGTGSLYHCSFDDDGWTCAFGYQNNDTCWRKYPAKGKPFWACLYPHP